MSCLVSGTLFLDLQKLLPGVYAGEIFKAREHSEVSPSSQESRTSLQRDTTYFR